MLLVVKSVRISELLAFAGGPIKTDFDKLQYTRGHS